MTDSTPQQSALPSVMHHLRALVEATGPSGCEEEVVQLIVKAARPYADSLEVDAFGNVIAVRRAAGDNPLRCVLSAHMDEVGFRVYKIGEGGFLRLKKVGGLDDRILPAQRVWIRSEGGEKLLGIIGTKSAHLLGDDDRSSAVPCASLYVDIGARSRQEVLDMGVAVGDPVGFVGSLTELGRQTGRYTAHALDDRAGCAVLLTLLERFLETPPPVTLVMVFSVQEEVGLRGAQALARHLQGDVALALDMTAADDTPEFAGPHLHLGAGPTVKIMDASLQAHPAIRRGLLGAAQKRGIAVQREVLRGIGTDAGALQYLAQGVPTGAVSVVNRYTHSPVEVLDRRDLDGAVNLCAQPLAQ